MMIRRPFFVTVLSLGVAIAMPQQFAFAMSPNTGDGSADWTVVHSGGTLYVHVEVNGGTASAIGISGVQPALTALPILAYNSNGEPLRIRKVNNKRVYSGTYDITIDNSLGSCTQCVCSILDPVCVFMGGSNQDCSAVGNGCSQWACGNGMGGITHLDLDYTTDPAPPF